MAGNSKCVFSRPPILLNNKKEIIKIGGREKPHFCDLRWPKTTTNLKGEEGLIGQQSVVLPNSRRGSTKALQYSRRSKSVTLLHPIRCSSQRRNLYPN